MRLHILKFGGRFFMEEFCNASHSKATLYKTL
jgi:hypothetical protein